MLVIPYTNGMELTAWNEKPWRPQNPQNHNILILTLPGWTEASLFPRTHTMSPSESQCYPMANCHYHRGGDRGIKTDRQTYGLGSCVGKFWLHLKMLCSLVGRKKSSTVSPAVNTVSYSKDWAGKICLWLILTFVIESLWAVDKIVLCQH